MSHIEKVDIEKAKYLLKLSDEYFLKEIFDPVEENDNGETYTPEKYLQNIKKWLKNVIKNKGQMKVSYKYSKNLYDKGRRYVRGFGIQSLQKDIRGFLCNDYYIDIDMVNASPTILLYINKKFFNDNEMPSLSNYINNRAKILNTFEINKFDIIKLLFIEWEYKGNNKFLQSLDKEIKIIQNLIWNSDHFNDISKANLKLKNKKGCFLNRVLCVYENKILTEAETKVKSQVPMFDGMFIDKDNDINNVLDLVNNNIYGIKWIVKPHSQKIQIDPVINSIPDIKDEYTIMKEKFEEKYFMIEQPLSYCLFRNGKIVKYNKSDFSDIVAPFQITNSKNELVPFFNKWLKDSDKRKYTAQDFIPDIENCPDDILNTFTGFEANYLEENERLDINLFLKLINLLCNNDKPTIEHMYQFIAHLFQKPYERPNIAVVFKGQKGVGKDLFINLLGEIIGKKYYFESSDLDSIFGKFNPNISHKLLINLAELQGDEGFKNDNKIKHFITSMNLTIADKGVKAWVEQNYLRLFMTSNSSNMLNVTSDNRRFWIIKTGNNYLTDNNRELLYKPLFSNLKNRQFLDSIYSHFMDIKINCQIDQFPTNDNLELLKHSNVSNVYKFMYELIIEKLYQQFQYMLSNDNNKLYLPVNDVNNLYKDWIEENYGVEYAKNLKKKNFILLLGEIKIYSKQKKIQTQNIRCYEIDLDFFNKIILTKYQPEISEELDCDVFNPKIECEYDSD